jgi:trimethylamine:corrinoid methyltransferase-like protein
MRTGVLITGSPEWDVLDRMTRDVMAYYGKRDSRKLLLTSASVPNAQAMIEKTASALTGFAEGYRDFGNLGQLACDEVYSPAQLMLDLEILGHAERAVAEPASFPELRLDRLHELALETIEDGCLFAEHETTAVLIRKQYWQPKILRRETMGQFLAAGSPDLVVQAEQEADRLAAQFHYEAPPEQMRELRLIYNRAASALGGAMKT